MKRKWLINYADNRIILPAPYKSGHRLSGSTAGGCCAGWRSPRTRAPRPFHSTGPAASCAWRRCPRRQPWGLPPSWRTWCRFRWARGAQRWMSRLPPRPTSCIQDTSCPKTNCALNTPDRRCAHREATRGLWRYSDTRGKWGSPWEAKRRPKCLRSCVRPSGLFNVLSLLTEPQSDVEKQQKKALFWRWVTFNLHHVTVPKK